jgi:hypothetical protein
MDEGSPASTKHGPVPMDWECLVTMEDITEDNYVEYLSRPSGLWQPAKIEQSVVEHLICTQFNDYVAKVRQSDCQAELRRLLESGPPIYVSDPHGLPLIETDTHIEFLWFSSDQQTRSARLQNAVEGAERERLWEELRAFAPSDNETMNQEDSTKTNIVDNSNTVTEQLHE